MSDGERLSRDIEPAPPWRGPGAFKGFFEKPAGAVPRREVTKPTTVEDLRAAIYAAGRPALERSAKAASQESDDDDD